MDNYVVENAISFEIPSEVLHIIVHTQFVACVIRSSPNNIAIWEIDKIEAKSDPTTILSGHEHDIQAICFNLEQTTNPFMCSVSNDRVMLWCIKEALYNPRTACRYVDGNINGRCYFASFCLEDDYIALCIENDIMLVNTVSCKSEVILRGHDNIITQCHYLKSEKKLISISDDKTFILWDLDEKRMCYQSKIFVNAIKKCEISSTSGKIFILTGDNLILSYSIDTKGECVESNSISIISMMNEYLDDLKRESEEKYNEDKPIIVTKVGVKVESKYDDENNIYYYNDKSLFIVIDMKYVDGAYNSLGTPLKTALKLKNNKKGGFIEGYNKKDNEDKHPPVIVILTSESIILLSPLNYMRKIIMLKDVIYIYPFIDIKNIYTMDSYGYEDINLAFDSNNKVNILKLIISENEDYLSSNLTIMPSHPPPPHSILFSTFKPKATPPPSTSTTSKYKVIMDQPIVFHRNIKSSGYTEKPWMPPSKKANKSKTKSPAIDEKEYPSDCGLLDKMQTKNYFPDLCHNGPIMCCRYSNNGNFILTTSSDKTGRSWELPLSTYKGKGIVFQGHNNVVNEICSSWNMKDKPFYLTCSDDNSACLWYKDRADPLIRFENMNKNIPRSKKSETTKPTLIDNPVFKSPIKNCSFYYQDDFIVLTHKNQLLLYNYYIESLNPKLDDIDKTHAQNQYRLVKSFSHSSNNIISMSCINGFLSHLILTVGSAKDLCIWDISSGKLLIEKTNIHERLVHHIRLPTISQYCNITPDSLNTFATSALDGKIKLWDLRTMNSVLCLSGHMNNSASVGLSFSPCMRYIATGSENNNGYIYDIRTGKIMSQLLGSSDTVSDVCWNPLKPQLCTSSYDGHIRFYTENG